MSQALACEGTPSISLYEGITACTFARFTAAAKGGKKYSRSVRSEIFAGPTFVPPSGWPWPVMCFRVASTRPFREWQRISLKPTHGTHTKLAHEKGIFAVSLFDTTPARRRGPRLRLGPARVASRAHESRAATIVKHA